MLSSRITFLILGAAFASAQVASSASARVLRVTPSGDSLPANQLKLYIWFSASMSRGEAWQRIHLLDSMGKPVELPFLEIEQELWDREQRRLTVLFDPGRLKRGLVPNEEVGPPLVEGRRYTFVIDEAWQDAEGRPLEQGFQKSFTVVAEDRTPPEPKRWHLAGPKSGTRDPLVIDFGEPLDAAILEHSISVVGPAGTFETRAHETQIAFRPDQPWAPGEYRLRIDHRLEDLAGNRIGRPFDVDVFKRVTKDLKRQYSELRFRVR